MIFIAYGLDASGSAGSALNQLLGTVNYGYTNRGNIASIATTGAAANRTRSYEYDVLERLKTVAGQVGNPTAFVENYTFDEEGNRVTSHASASHLTGPANRLTEDDTHVYAYDENGNMVQKTVKATGAYWTYSYSLFDQLIRAQQYDAGGSRLADFNHSYDAFGRRLYVTSNPDIGASDVAWYHYDGHDVYRRTQKPSRFSGTTSRRDWFTTGIAINDVLAITPADSANLEQPGNQSFYYHKDHQGSVRALTNDAGAVVNSYDYDSYGNIKSTSETVPQPFRYTGQQYDIGPQLYYYRNRTYDPRTGRFLQEDPLWFGGGDLNTYNYVWNNPTNWVDPLGLSAIEYGLLPNSGEVAGETAGAIVDCLFNKVLDEVSVGFAGKTATHAGKCSVIGIFPHIAQGSNSCGIGGKAGRGASSRAGRTSGAFSSGGGVPSSFADDTLVLTKAGLVAIKDIKVGDQVAAFDKSTSTTSGKNRWQKVTARHIRKAKQALKITVRGADGKSETIVVTLEHPFLTPAATWHTITRFKVGDKIATLNGKHVTITAIKGDASERDVYNLTVKDDHSYSVGKQGVWSHNGLGAYVIFRRGKVVYVGKGGRDRAKFNAKKFGDNEDAYRHFKSKTDCGSFRLENRLIQSFGGIEELPENKINSPGKNYLPGGGKRKRGGRRRRR